MDDDVQIESAPLDVLAQPPVRIGFLHGAVEALRRAEVLAPDVHVGLVAANAVSGDDHALQQRMRVALEEIAILERPRFSFVGVHDQINRLCAVLRDERPLLRRRESGSAETAEIRARHLVDDLRGRQRKRPLRCDVPSARDVRVPPRPVRVPQPCRDDWTSGRDERLGLATGARRRAVRRRDGGQDRVRRSLQVPVEGADELFVELGHRRDFARTQALDFCHGQLAARSRFTSANPQLIFDAEQHVVCSAQQTGQTRADAKLPPACRRRAEHRIEGNDFAHVRDRKPKMASDPELRLGRNMTELRLHQPQERQHRRPWLVVSLDDFPCLWVERVEIHRSSSPPIMLTDPNVGVRSAIMSPTRSLGRADMIAKQGGRTRTRYALLLPSLTT